MSHIIHSIQKILNKEKLKLNEIITLDKPNSLNDEKLPKKVIDIKFNVLI